MTLRARSCPTCHSIGEPRHWAEEIGKWVDVPPPTNISDKRCADAWHTPGVCVMSERLTADISHDLRASAQDMRAGHRNTDAGLLTEAADKLDGLIALLAQAETERDQLRYERRLLGFARMTLDLVAAGPPDRWEQARQEAEDIAQRIVDEIGHPVTDEDALGPSYREQLAALTAALDASPGDETGQRDDDLAEIDTTVESREDAP